MLAFLSFAAVAVVVALAVLMGFILVCAKLFFGLVLLPLRLAALGIKLVAALAFLLVGLPFLALGAPLLLLLFGLAVVAAPFVLVVWALSSIVRAPARA